MTSTSSWTCTVCSNENDLNLTNNDALRTKCDLCNAPKPKTIPLELIATIPLASILLFIAIALPAISDKRQSLENYIHIDMASIVTFAHTALLGAFGTVAWLSHNSLFGASIQLALTFATAVTVSTLLSLSYDTKCISSTYYVPLILIVFFGTCSMFGSVVICLTNRYPTFLCARRSDRPKNNQQCHNNAALRSILLFETFVIILFIFLRGIIYPTNCSMNNSQNVLLGFIESFHMAFHESFLLGCGYAALWDHEFYIDLLSLSSAIYGVFYSIHFIGAFLSITNSDTMNTTNTTSIIYIGIRAFLKVITYWISYRMKTIEQKQKQLDNSQKTISSNLSWIRYLPQPTIFYIWCSTKTINLRLRARIGSFLISISGILTTVAFHYECMILLDASTSVSSYENIFSSLNFGIHGMMVLPYLCGLFGSSQAYLQFRYLHVILNLIACLGSLATAQSANNLIIQSIGNRNSNVQVTTTSETILVKNLVFALLLRAVGSGVMAFGFMFLTPELLRQSLEEGVVEKKNSFVRLGTSNEEEEDHVDRSIEMLPIPDNNSKEEKEKERKNNHIDDTSSWVASLAPTTVSSGHSVETQCTLQEMTTIHAWQYWIKKTIVLFVATTALFTIVCILLNATAATTPDSNANNPNNANNDDNSKNTTISSNNQNLQNHHPERFSSTMVAPELLGYGFIFHVSFLLPMFTLHGLLTGTLMTLRVGVLFSLSVAIIIPSVAIHWLNQQQHVPVVPVGISFFGGLCCISSILLFIGGTLYYIFLSIYSKSKHANVSNEDSSLTKVFGRVRKR